MSRIAACVMIAFFAAFSSITAQTSTRGSMGSKDAEVDKPGEYTINICGGLGGFARMPAELQELVDDRGDKKPPFNIAFGFLFGKRFFDGFYLISNFDSQWSLTSAHMSSDIYMLGKFETDFGLHYIPTSGKFYIGAGVGACVLAGQFCGYELTKPLVGTEIRMETGFFFKTRASILARRNSHIGLRYAMSIFNQIGKIDSLSFVIGSNQRF